MPSPEAHGEVALMLFESLLHLLVEERIIGKEKALEAIEGVAGHGSTGRSHLDDRSMQNRNVRRSLSIRARASRAIAGTPIGLASRK